MYNFILDKFMNERRFFYRNNKVAKFSKGETIFLLDEIPKHIYCIKSGVIKIFSVTSNGNKQLINFEIVGDILPKSVAFSISTKTLFEYTAFTDCELYVINIDDFKSQIAYNIDFTKKMLNRLACTLVGLSLKVDALEKSNAEYKLAYIFRYLCLLFGTNRLSGHVRIEVPLTQQDIAELTGLTRETINMEIHLLTKLKIISSCHKYFIVDTTNLNKLIDDDYKPNPALQISD